MSQPGGCFCDKVRISYSGEPVAHAICHCLDCRKISGSSYSNNLILPEENFKVESGTPKQISKIADTGKEITSHFCGDCGTTLYRTGETFAGQVILKVGVMDDPEWPNKNVPKVELFEGRKVQWQKPIDGASSIPGMP